MNNTNECLSSGTPNQSTNKSTQDALEVLPAAPLFAFGCVEFGNVPIVSKVDDVLYYGGDCIKHGIAFLDKMGNHKGINTLGETEYHSVLLVKRGSETARRLDAIYN